MPAGSAVIRYAGKRGIVWRIKYLDADGRQVMETLGPERDGWTERKAKAELRERLVRVERRGWRRPAPLTFAEYAKTWRAEGERLRGWKPGSVRSYRVVVDRLNGYLGTMPLAAIRRRDVTAYVAQVSADYAPATVVRDVSVLHAIFTSAKLEELVDSNPAERAERPKASRRRWRILEPVEVARVARELTDEQDRAAFLTLVLTGLRRHELVGLRWRDVALAEGVLRVRDSKTEEGVRSIALAPGLAEELWQHRRRSAFQGDDERVFHHPKTGGPFRPTSSGRRSTRPSPGQASPTTFGHSTTCGTPLSRTTPPPARARSRSCPRPGTPAWQPRSVTCTSPGRYSATRQRPSSGVCSAFGQVPMEKPWREYQEKAAGFFRELGLDAETDVRIVGARAAHDIDVLVRFNLFGVKQTWIVECKLHRRKVKKADVLTLQSVVQDVGADRGFLLSESGFQSGAVTATRHSNVDLSDLADLRTNAEADILDLRWNRVFDRVAKASTRLDGLVTRTRVGKYGGRIDLPPYMNHDDFLWWRAHFGVLRDSLQAARVGAFPVAYAFERAGDRVFRADGLEAFLEKAEEVLDEGERWLAETEASRAVESSTGSSTDPGEPDGTGGDRK